MIDIDKMKAAFAATALCQKQQDSPTSPTRLCAISALVSFAGVQPALIARMQATEPETVRVEVSERPSDWADVQRRRPSIDHDYAVMLCPRWVADLALPVLQAEYGIPRRIAAQFPNLFDGEANEWRGVEAVLRLCERANRDMLHDAALQEDYARSQQALVLQLQQQTNHAARAAAMASVTSFEKMWQIMEADLKKQPLNLSPFLVLTPKDTTTSNQLEQRRQAGVRPVSHTNHTPDAIPAIKATDCGGYLTRNILLGVCDRLEEPHTRCRRVSWQPGCTQERLSAEEFETAGATPAPEPVASEPAVQFGILAGRVNDILERIGVKHGIKFPTRFWVEDILDQVRIVLPVGTVIHQHSDVAGVRPAINTLRRAIEDPGPFPLYHADVMARIRTEWPTLMQAVDAILEADAR